MAITKGFRCAVRPCHPAGLSLQGWYNKVVLPGHQGPHGWYNSLILRELGDAVAGQTPGTRAYSQKLFTALITLRSRVRDPNDLLPLVTTSILDLEKKLTRSVL